MSISHLSNLLLKPSCQVMLLNLLVVWNCTHFLQHVDARRRSLQRPQRITHVLQLASCESTLTLPVHMRANTCISSYLYTHLLGQLFPLVGGLEPFQLPGNRPKSHWLRHGGWTKEIGPSTKNILHTGIV